MVNLQSGSRSVLQPTPRRSGPRPDRRVHLDRGPSADGKDQVSADKAAAAAPEPDADATEQVQDGVDPLPGPFQGAVGRKERITNSTQQSLQKRQTAQQ